jgi:hypothetical protein
MEEFQLLGQDLLAQDINPGRVAAPVLSYDAAESVLMGNEMAKKITRTRPWTKDEVRMLKSLAREKTKTTVIARKLKRSVAAVYLRASKLAVMLGGGRKKRA